MKWAIKENLLDIMLLDYLQWNSLIANNVVSLIPDNFSVDLTSKIKNMRGHLSWLN